jgi:hypothetical protein
MNRVGELFTVNDSDAEDSYEDEDKELAQLLPNFLGHLAALISLAMYCVI